MANLPAAEMRNVQYTAPIVKGFLSSRYRSALMWLIKYVANKVAPGRYETISGFIKFLMLMLHKEKTLCATFFDSYRDDQNVCFAVHLMMDMERAYNEQPNYVFHKEQIKRMEGVVNGAAGKTLGFVAFDPRRDNWKEIIEYGLNRGNCGIKLYAPMGYLPIGNTPTHDARLMELYHYCNNENLPIMLHCTPVGFEAKKGFGVKSDPELWDTVLETIPSLKICFGHAGGGGDENYEPGGGSEKVPYPGWFAANDTDWNSSKNFARKTVDRCIKHENVFCDLSYLHDAMYDDDVREQLRSRLIEAVSRNDGPFNFADKFMYGSDWHMPHMALQTSKYLDMMIDILDNAELSQHKEKCFNKNSQRFLDLKRYVKLQTFSGQSHVDEDVIRYIETVSEY